MERRLTKNLKSKEDLKQAVSEYFILDRTLNSVIELNHEQIKGYIESLNSESKYTFITGFSGVGKSEILRLTPALLENTGFFCFDCFKSACVDDIIFSLYRYFTSIKSAKIQRHIKRTFAKTRSIDERIFGLLANLPINLVIAFDSFENFINESDKIPHDIARFLSFLSEQSNIKIVTSSPIPAIELIKKHPLSTTIRIEEFSFMKFLEFQKTFYPEVSQDILQEVFESTNGIALSIKNFFEAARYEDPHNLYSSAMMSKIDFSIFIASKLLRNLSTKEQELLYLISCIRHPIAKEALENSLFQNNREEYYNLLDTPLVYSLNEKIFIKNNVKTSLDKLIPKTKKSTLHEILADFYNKEVPLKHFERNIKLSRVTLKNEASYHLSLVESKKSSEVNMIASALNSDIILFKDTKPLISEEELRQKQATKEPAVEEIETLASQNITINHIEAPDETPILSDEERKILYDEAQKLQKEDERQEAKERKERGEKEKRPLLIDGVELEHEMKKSQIIRSSDFYKLLETALNYEEKGNYTSALKEFKKTIEICQTPKKMPLLYNKIAKCYTKLKNKNEAMNALKDAYNEAKKLDDNKQIAFVILNLGRTLREFGDYKEAEKHFNDFLDMNILGSLPKGQAIIALMDLGDLYVDMNNEDNALTVYETALKQAGPGFKGINEIYFKIGVTFDNMGKIDKAKDFYQRATQSILSEEKTDKYFSESCSNLGLIYAEEGDYPKALQLLEKAFLSDKNNENFEGVVNSASKLADTYFDNKDYKSAQKYYYEKLKAAKSIKSPYLLATAYLDIGDVYIRTNNLQKSLQAFLLAKRSLGKEMSTDSKEKITRRIEFIKSKLSDKEFQQIMEERK